MANEPIKTKEFDSVKSMDERKLQFRVGVFVLLAIAILFALIYLNSEIRVGQYTLYLKSNAAPGVKANTPVRKNGILIGRVISVTTADNGVYLALSINNDEKIYANEVASIGAASILGDAVVEIIPIAVEKRGEPLVADDLIKQTAIKRNPMEIVDVALNLQKQISETLETFDETAKRVGAAGDGVDKLAKQIQQAIGSANGQEIGTLVQNFREVSKKANTALDNFNQIFENINEVVGDQDFKNRFNNAVGRFPEIFKDVRGAIADLRKTVTSFQKVSDKADANLENLKAFTKALETDGPEILATINDRLKSVDGIFEKIENATQSLDGLKNSQGTLGKLINDPELYDNVLETVKSAREAVENIRRQTSKIEPLINDARLFADAIARDPGVLGVRGAISNRKPAKTGYKSQPMPRQHTR